MSSSALAQEQESEELRALRLAELEVFPPHAEPLVDLTQVDRGLGLLPRSMTSDVPDAAPEIATGTTRDLSWLEGLTLPDIPIRWDERVIRYLEFFRDDPRGRSLIRGWMARVEPLRPDDPSGAPSGGDARGHPLPRDDRERLSIRARDRTQAPWGSGSS